MVALVGAIIGAIGGAIGYIVNAAITGNWSWGGFGQAISGAIGGIIAPSALFQSIVTNGLLGTAAIAAASSFLPSVDVKIGDWSFGLSPALAFGRATGFGVNISASYQDGNFNFSAGYGVTFYGSAHGTGHKGWEYRKSWGVNWDDGKQGIGIYSTTFKGENSQKVGGVSYRNGNFGFRYENDGTPFQKKWFFGGILGDGGDRFRTAALNLSYKEYSLGFNLFTGSRTEYNRDKAEMAKGLQYGRYGEKMPYGFVKETGTPYRLGALYVGYRGSRLGIDSDRYVRHGIQDIGAHSWISKQPGFRSLSDNINGYFQYQSHNPYTLW
ncbi:MAG: polymorphic toxin type 23 domain-containing protein [Polaribacter sp.]